MILRTPRLSIVGLYLALGIITTAAGNKLALSEFMAAAAWLMQWVFYCLAAFAFFDWFMAVNVFYIERLQRTRLASKSSIAAETLAKLTPAQLDILRAEILGTKPDETGQTTYTTIDGTDIPDEWIKKYLLTSVGMNLTPVRRYPDKSTDRIYATRLVAHLERVGAITPAAGPNPARVNDWNSVYQALGWV